MASSNVRLEKDLSFSKRVKVQTWRSEPRVDIRVYGADFAYPTKKGVSLTLARYKVLKLNKDDLEQALIKCEKRELASKFVVHLGGGVYATVSPGWEYVDLRAYFLPVAKEEGAGEAEGGELKDHPMVSVGSDTAAQLQPTKRGVMLSKAEWFRLWESQDEIEAVTPELDLTDSCLAPGLVHENQLECLDCKECHPFFSGF